MPKSEKLNKIGELLYSSTKAEDEAIERIPFIGKPFVELNDKLCRAGIKHLLPVSCDATHDALESLNAPSSLNTSLEKIRQR